jgi:hypothetical protein
MGLLAAAISGQAPPQPQPPPLPDVPVQIQGDLSIPCYGFARLRLMGSATSAGWLCFPDRTTGAQLVSSYTADGGRVYLFSGPPGSYDIGVFATIPAGVATVQVVVTIRPPGDRPTPPPGPAPQPQPPAPQPQPPAPTPKPAFPSTQGNVPVRRIPWDLRARSVAMRHA